MTLTAAPVAETPADPSPASGRHGIGAGWLPVVLLLGGTAAVLLWYGVRGTDLFSFASYLMLGLTVPGTLLWRGLRGQAGLLVLDVTAGTVLGYAVEVLTYLAARAVGAPRLVLLWPVLVIGACLLRPRLRRHWRGNSQRVPWWWAWALCALVGLVVAFSAVGFWRTHGLTWPASQWPYLDMPFHLALAGELKHHVPPAVPYVLGEPLNYHWFVYAELAATSWVTGIEPEVLLYRLSLLPMAALSPVLVAVAASQLTGRAGRPGPWWPGPIAAMIFLLTTALNPYGWTTGPVATGSTLGVLWISPTQTFGVLLVLPLVIVLMDLLRGADGPVRASLGRWLLLIVLLAATTGAKATFLPMLLAALLLVILVQAVARRRAHRPAMVAGVLVAAALAFAQAVLFAGFSGGLQVRPLQTALMSPALTATGLVTADAGGWVVAFAVLVCVLSWMGMGSGWVGLLAARRHRTDPAVVLCAGMVAAGMGAALTFSHPGASQLYFLASARPYLALLAVAGIAAVLPAWRGPDPPTIDSQRRPNGWRAADGRWPVGGWPVGGWRAADGRRPGGWPVGRWSLLAGAVVGGVVTTLLVRWGTGAPPRLRAGAGRVRLAAELGWPFAVVLLGAVLIWLVLRRLPARAAAGRALALPASLLFATGAVVPAACERTVPEFTVTGGWRDAPAAGPQYGLGIPAGATVSGRWLRENSRAEDVVATNVHCRVVRRGACENRHFWVAAYTERRILVEGWGYTAHAHDVAQRTALPPAFVPFWDRRRLADNDAAFQAPSGRTLGVLRQRYGVRWLLVDRRVNPPAATLERHARLRLRAGDCEVYEIVR